MNDNSTSTNTPKELNCPTCQKIVCWSEDYPYRPFCSHRCQLIDLGEWANETYRVPANNNSGADDDFDTNTEEWK